MPVASDAWKKLDKAPDACDTAHAALVAYQTRKADVEIVVNVEPKSLSLSAMEAQVAIIAALNNAMEDTP